MSTKYTSTEQECTEVYSYIHPDSGRWSFGVVANGGDIAELTRKQVKALRRQLKAHLDKSKEG